jgi:hypothetical protein
MPVECLRKEEVMPQLVAYFDILGTSEMVTNDRFSDWLALDFANPVGLAAHEHPKLRFAVFSDCVIISCDSDNAEEFVSVIRELYLSWFSDGICVRGGIARGEIYWVDFELDKRMFNNLPNFSHARVYGKGLVQAYNLERRSGPGAVAFVSDEAASLIESSAPNSIVRGTNNVLNCLSPEFLLFVRHFLQSMFDDSETSEQAKPHYRATIDVIDSILKKPEASGEDNILKQAGLNA